MVEGVSTEFIYVEGRFFFPFVLLSSSRRGERLTHWLCVILLFFFFFLFGTGVKHFVASTLGKTIVMVFGDSISRNLNLMEWLQELMGFLHMSCAMKWSVISSCSGKVFLILLWYYCAGLVLSFVCIESCIEDED